MWLVCIVHLYDEFNEIKEWCDENLGWYKLTSISFAANNEEDFIAFKLRWL